ncbi:MAG: prepilin-type N-terminal cleavage/methylation domain-containing protein [Vicinamibacterales bacterium]
MKPLHDAVHGLAVSRRATGDATEERLAGGETPRQGGFCHPESQEDASFGCRGHAGYTLVETLVALVLVLLVAAAAMSVLGTAEAAFGAQSEAADLQQRLRAASLMLEHDLLAAGAGTYSGPRAGSLAYSFPPVFPCRVGFAAADPPGSSRTDTISIVHVPATASQTRTAAVVARSSATLDVAILPGCPLGDAACGFRAGMMVVVFDERGAFEMFAVGTVAGATLTRRAGTFENEYAAGAVVAEVRTATFYTREDTAAGGLQLRRYDGDGSDLPLVDNLTRFEVEYMGEPAPPRVREPSEDPREARTTYGPGPGVNPPVPEYPAGESCTFRLEGGAIVPRLAVLAEGPALVTLPPAAFTDGPWCPAVSFATRFDADLLRIRNIRVTIGAQAASPASRGTDSGWFLRPGTALRADRMVPDHEVRIQVSPRNLSLGR